MVDESPHRRCCLSAGAASHSRKGGCFYLFDSRALRLPGANSCQAQALDIFQLPLQNGGTPLLYAVRGNHLKCVETLLGKLLQLAAVSLQVNWEAEG